MDIQHLPRADGLQKVFLRASPIGVSFSSSPRFPLSENLRKTKSDKRPSGETRTSLTQKRKKGILVFRKIVPREAPDQLAMDTLQIQSLLLAVVVRAVLHHSTASKPHQPLRLHVAVETHVLIPHQFTPSRTDGPCSSSGRKFSHSYNKERTAPSTNRERRPACRTPASACRTHILPSAANRGCRRAPPNERYILPSWPSTCNGSRAKNSIRRTNSVESHSIGLLSSSHSSPSM